MDSFSTSIAIILVLIIMPQVNGRWYSIQHNLASVYSLKATQCLFDRASSITCLKQAENAVTHFSEAIENDFSFYALAVLPSNKGSDGNFIPSVRSSSLKARVAYQRYLNIAEQFASKNDPIVAERVYRTLTALYPQYAEGYYDLGRLYLSLRRFDDAMMVFEQGKLADPDRVSLGLFLQGFTQFRHEKWEDAVYYLRQANEIAQTRGGLSYSEPGQLHYFLGEALRRLGETDEAFQEFQRVIDLDPDLRWTWPTYAAHVGLGDIYLSERDYAAAESAYRTAMEIADNDAQRSVVNQRIGSIPAK